MRQDKIFDVNVKAAFCLCQEVVPVMRTQGGGSIIFVASIAGFTPLPNIGAYSVSKTALIGLSKALSVELAADAIRVNAIAPGYAALNQMRNLLHSSCRTSPPAPPPP
jgi:dehydrogenase/reductase SDR family member 4